LVVNISIINEFIQNRQFKIIKNSKEEEKFIAELIEVVREINTSCLESKESLKVIVQEFSRIMDYLWQKHSKCVNITKHSKTW